MRKRRIFCEQPMARHATKPKYASLVVSLALAAIVLTLGILLIDDLGWQKVLKRLLWPLARLMLFIGVGLIAGQVIEALGWTRFLALLAGPLFRFGNLGQQCSAAFTTAFVSGVAANAMLIDFYKDGKITRRQLFLTNFVNQFPAFFLHLPTTFFIVIPLTGRAGALYFLLTFFATVLRTILFLVYGHLKPAFNPGPDTGETPDAAKRVSSPSSGRQKGLWQGIKQKLPGRITNIAVYVVPIYILVFVINAMGLFDLVRQWLAEYVVTTLIPVEAYSLVILGFAAEFTSGFAAAGALLEAGVLTTPHTVLALLIGNVVAFPIRALRHQLPRYMGIFSPKMGLQLLLMGQGFRVLSLVLVGTAYYYLGQ